MVSNLQIFMPCSNQMEKHSSFFSQFMVPTANESNKKPKQSSTSYSKDPYKLQITKTQKTKPNFFITQKPKKKKKCQIIKYVSYIRIQINNNQITEQTTKIL